jgi:hypothetical protein
MTEQTKPPKNESGATLNTPAGKIRPGNRKVYRKCSREDYERRIIFTKGLLAKRAYKSEIKALLYKRYDVSARQAEVYIARARELRRQESGATPEEAREDSVALYISLIRESEDERVKLIAQERLDTIFGVYAPPKVPVLPDGTPAPPGRQVVNVNLVRNALNRRVT